MPISGRIMIKNRLLFILAGSLLCLTGMTSCAERDDPDLTDFQQEVYDLWMKKHHPEAEKLDNGIYVQWFRKNSSDKKLSTGYWMMLDYTGTTQLGDYYISRSADIARQVGFFAYTTHYTPEYLQYDPGSLLYNGQMATGQIAALEMMSEGDSLRIYLSGSLSYAYGYSNSSYSGFTTFST